MKKRQLGKTILEVSELGLGGAPLGNLYRAVSNKQVGQALKAAWEKGVRYFDTAPQYGSGLSEHRLGHFFQEHPRDEFVLSTKVGKLLKPTRVKVEADEQWFIDPLPNEVIYDYSYDAMKRSVEDSLHRLSLSHIDIIHIHDLDHIVLGDDFPHHFKQAMESGYKALAEFKQQGVIDAISMGIKQWQVCKQALEYGDFDCFMLQDSYTLLDHDALDFLDECEQRQISILQAGPFSSGILVKGSAAANAKYKYSDADKSIIDRVVKLEHICEQYNVPLAAAALQFPLRHPAIASVVTGMRAHDQVEKNVEWLQQDIPQALWSEMKKQGLIPENAY